MSDLRPHATAATLRVPDDVVYRPMGKRTIVMNVGTGRYLALEDTGRDIWRRLVELGSMDAAIAALMADFDVGEATCRAEVTAFVEIVSSLGLLREGLEQADTAPAVLRLEHDRTAVASSEAIAAAAGQFRQHAFVKLEGVLGPPLLDVLLARLARTEFYEREHHGIGVEECAVSGPATGTLELMMNQPEVHRVIDAITGCGPIGCFEGRVYRLAPGLGHYDSWHSDVGQGRLVAISLNLSPRGFEGGALQLRKADSEEVISEVVNRTLGDAVLFKVHPDYRHRVQGVTGVHPRTAYAGWFRSEPDFLELAETQWRGEPGPVA
jgi:hypothetical protein